MSIALAGPLSGERMNSVLAQLETWAQQQLDGLLAAFYESGYPVGTEPTTLAEQYLELIRLRDAGDPAYWQSAQAQKELVNLSKKYGPPPPVAVPSFSGIPFSPPPQAAPPPPSLSLQAAPLGQAALMARQARVVSPTLGAP